MKHVPLQVPAGWEIKQNHFYNVLVEEKLNGGLLDYPFYEDILYMVNRNRMVAIDLGWYPDSDPTGNYSLKLLRIKIEKNVDPQVKKTMNRKVGDSKVEYQLIEKLEVLWNIPIDVFYSRDIIKIQNKLNEFLLYNGT